ncbi:hypothetical protein Leryth_013638 [Lithospermum erythrorhizon]|nr:hypothetical protein Leryth_013638 [Lithospermum erythrorhizon]
MPSLSSPTYSSPVIHKNLHSSSCSKIRCSTNFSRVNTKPQDNNNNGLASFPEKNLHSNPSTKKPPRPRRIILVRHGESEGNVDETVYTRVADPKIGLTPKGVEEAEECGRKIKEMIEKDDGVDDWKVYFYVSPYRRSIETVRSLAKSFERSRIAGIREEPRLREQDFGNFQDEQQMKIEKDVYDRITGFRETLRTDIDIGRFQPPGEQSPNVNLVLVSHGLTLRVFLMRWYKWTVEQFEGLYNMGNGKIIVMERGHGGRYSLLMHHNKEELKAFGLTEEMLIDQEWQNIARPGELNYDCLLTGPSFFTHFDDDHKP